MPRRPDYFRYAYSPDGSDFAARLNAAPQSDDVLMPVSFIRRLRTEIKFDSLDALRAQIAADCAAVFGPSL